MKQYESCLPGEYLKIVSSELSVAMGIEIDYRIIEETAKNDGEPGEQCIAVFRKDKAFILYGLQNNDWLQSIVVRCNDEDSDNVKAIVLKWDIEARKQYHQEERSDLEDRFGLEQCLLNDIIKVHGISI